MPYINIKVTPGGVTREQKAQIIQQVTDVMVRVLNKDPATTFVLIDEVGTDNWGVHGTTVTELKKVATKEARNKSS